MSFVGNLVRHSRDNLSCKNRLGDTIIGVTYRGKS